MNEEQIELARAQEEARIEEEQQKQEILRQVCRPEALDRLKRVRLVNKDKVEAVERWILRLARDGKLTSQLREEDIVQILSKQDKDVPQVTFARKKRMEDDEDDDDSDLR
jgi:programmed cell death protein 5